MRGAERSKTVKHKSRRPAAVQRAGNRSGGTHLVSCLMVSRGKLFPAEMAINCYRQQTYANRELVIVSANPDGMLRDFVAGLEDPSIRFIQVPPMPLGELRNASVDAARGDFLCTWDDDDLYGRHRIERQLEACLKSNAAGHFLNRVMLWWPDRRLMGISGQRPWENTMLVRREALPRYPAIALREDTPVVQELERRHGVTTSDDPQLYCYAVHSTNTCGDAHFEHLFEHADWIYADYDDELVRLSGQYPVRAYSDQLIAISASRQSETFTRADGVPLALCADMRFGAENLKVDGIAFRNCTFEGTRLIYLGGSHPVFENCSLSHGDISFEGSASNTVNWIRYLKSFGMELGI